MVLYRKGKIVYKDGKNLIFESNNVGYYVMFPDNERIKVNQEIKMYLYEIKNDFTWSLYGFKELEERKLFADLLNLNGIGPRVAFNVLNVGFDKVVNLIRDGNIEEIAKIEYINPRLARIIVEELKEKLSSKSKDVKKLKLCLKIM